MTRRGYELTARSHYDVIVVGAGMGGLYGVMKIRSQGYAVLGLESASDVGGVWFHNRYPGARVDVESHRYCYYFDAALFNEWRWQERYAAQPELLAYFRHVADRFDLRRSFLFNHRVVSGVWEPKHRRWRVTTQPGTTFYARYLVMATGQLSRSRRPPYPGLDDFKGEWTQTSEWHEVALEGKRVAVLGTGSSGVQAATAIAEIANHTYVLQRTAGYVVPVNNGPFDSAEHSAVSRELDATWSDMLHSPTGLGGPGPVGRVGNFSHDEQQRILEERWAIRPFDVFGTFSDVATDADANAVLSEFVRRKARERIDDPELASKVLTISYPIGARRVVFASGYYEALNRDHVTLVDLREDPLDRFVPRGLKFKSGSEIEIDTMVFAIGFDAFMGAIAAAGIQNEHGARPFEHWTRRPETLLGLMTRGFPNLFVLTGPGSPSTLSSNMNLSNVHDVDFVAGLIEHAENLGKTQIEPTADAVREWSDHVQSVARDHLSLQDDNYMVQVNDDGTRAMIPYVGGVGEYVRRAHGIASANYAGFTFT